MAYISDFPRYVGHAHATLYKTTPYSPSNASTTSSTSSSAFSVDAPSSQSSVSCSSVDDWASSAYRNENENPNSTNLQPLRRQDSASSEEDSKSCPAYLASRPLLPGAVAPSSRQHPRRTQRLSSYESQDGTKINQCPLPPPSLVRQSERKDNFVESLVDTSTQMIEAIWPLSVSSCAGDTGSGAKRQQLLNLRTFVQEVLKRSKTSYSTLQVALYYLILIQSCLPKHDFTMEQMEDSTTYRAMQCGRRMFLAALILASKYLQDRNFSARAWSKISGLRICEINSNECAFLSAVGWALHVPKKLFDKWENIVMNYSPAARVNTHPRSLPTSSFSWKSFVRTLTPELDGEFPFDIDDDSGYGSANSDGSDSGSDTESAGSDAGPDLARFNAHSLLDMAPPPIPIHDGLDIYSGSQEPTPTNSFAIPRTLEPAPRDTTYDVPTVPQMPRMGLLPTPQLTPQTGTFSTPAVNASGFCFKKPSMPSMACAMAQMRSKDLSRYNDSPCEWGSMKLPPPFPTSARQSSVARSVSSISSPESMMSDRSSRSSRSSSISSNASSNCALPQPRLAVEASRRCANMQLCGLREESGQSTPTQKGGKDLNEMSWVEYSEATCPGYKKPVIGNLDQILKMLPSNKAAARTSAHTANCSVLPPNPDALDGASTQEAAAALSEMALNRQQLTPTPPQDLPTQQPISRPSSAKSLKRPRPTSIDLTETCLQSMVRQQLTQSNEDDSTVSPDETVADSFFLRKEDQHRKRYRGPAPLRTLDLNKQPAKASLGKEGSSSRKRACAGSDRGARGEARMYERRISAGGRSDIFDGDVS